MTLRRVFTHLLAMPWQTRRRFPSHVLAAIEQSIAAVESRHAGEIRFVVETSLDGMAVWRGLSARERALEVFGRLGVWDTADNNGVLIYLLMCERDVQIVADRGIAARVAPAEWEEVCRRMEAEFREGRFREGATLGVESVGELLAQHFPSAVGDRNEQPNRPVLL